MSEQVVGTTADGLRMRAGGWSSNVSAHLVELLLVAVAVGAWAGVTASGLVSPTVLPDVPSTAKALWGIVTTPTGLYNVSVTAREAGGAFALACPGGIVLGYLLGEYSRRNKQKGRQAEGLLGTFFATPKFLLLPIVILILGLTYWEKVVYGLSDAVVVMITASATATRLTDEDTRVLCRALGMTRLQLFTKVLFPTALPVILEGIRLSVIFVLGAVLLAEMYLSEAGMGHLVLLWASQYDLAALFAAVILVGMIALAANALIRTVERSLTRWMVPL